MRASLFIVAVLALAACASSGAPSSTNPQAVNAANRFKPNTAAGDRLSLRFENITPTYYLTGNALRFTCVTSAKPDYFNLGYHETAKVDIVGDTQGSCKDGSREVDFIIYFRTKGYEWFGDLDVWYHPQSGWTGRLRGISKGVDLCTDPPLAEEGRLEDNALIRFYPCG